jgi:hypothetical protein
MKRYLLSAILTGATLASVAFAGAKFLKVKPMVLDPEDTGLVSAAWVTKQGLADAGKSDHALYLAKLSPTSATEAAGAVVDGVKGIQLSEIGWDVRTDSHCTSGAPQLNVVTSDDVSHILNCNSPALTSTTLLTDRRGAVWERRRYDPALADPAITTGSTVKSLAITFGEGTDLGAGWVYLDNIDVNGTLVGRPGNAKLVKIK